MRNCTGEATQRIRRNSVANPTVIRAASASPAEVFRKILEAGIPVLGIVENMSYFKCPDCGGIHEIFGKSRLEEIARKYGIFNTARIPVDPALASLVDAGEVEQYEGDFLKELTDALNRLTDAQN